MLLTSLCILAGTLLLTQPTQESVRELVKNLDHKESSVRARAAGNLADLGPKAAAAVPELIKGLEDECQTVRDMAAYALGRVGGKAVPELKKALRSKDAEVRRQCLYALGWVALSDDRKSLEANSALPAIYKMLWDDCRSVRLSAHDTIVKIGTKEALSELISVVMGESDLVVQYSAISAIGAFEERGSDAIPILMDIFRRHTNNPLDYGNLGPAASDSLGLIGSSAVPALVELARDRTTTPELRTAIAGTFHHMALVRGPDSPKAAVPALIDLLKDSSESVRISAAMALGSMKVAAKPSIPALMKLMRSRKRPKDQVYAAGALFEIDPHSKEVLPTLMEAVDTDPSLRASALNTLVEMGTKALPVLDRLIKWLDDPSDQVRLGSINAIRRMGSAARSAIPALQKATKDRKDSVRIEAERVLRELTEEKKGAP